MWAVWFGNRRLVRWDSRELAVGDAVDRFRTYITHENLSLRRWAVAELAGKDLTCWCPPGMPCHADVLLEIANVPAVAA